MADNFTWTPDDPPPRILAHTKCKLDVITEYLSIYLDTLSQNVRMDRLNVSFVDGFCGGGHYRSNDGLVIGSPLILIKAVEKAEKRINEKRHKPLSINARYYFIDSNPNHIIYLRKTLLRYGYKPNSDDQIIILEGAFEAHLPAILKNIQKTQTAGKSIFLLDQCGYKDVLPSTLKPIFEKLRGAEAIVTFAIDALLNYLNKDKLDSDLYRAFKINQNFIDLWREQYGNNLPRPLAQRFIMKRFLSVSKFMTPFMLYSESDHRNMALIHLSNHQTARDKMLGVHWYAHNSFLHCGKGSLYTPGFNSGLIETGNALFNFRDRDRARMRQELIIDLPSKIHELTGNHSLSLRDLLDKIGNNTAAPNSDICEVIKSLAQEKEIVITSSKGKLRRPTTLPDIGDILEIPKQQTFFPILRGNVPEK